MKKTSPIFVILIGLTTVSCIQQRADQISPLIDQRSPAEQVQRSSVCLSDTPDQEDVQILGTRDWSQGRTVLYTIPCGDIFGYSVFAAHNSGWELVHSTTTL